MEKDKQKIKNKNFAKALLNSINGIIYAVKTQRNIKIQIVALIAVLIISAIFKISHVEFLFIIFACGLVFVAEMLNTAIEEAVNMVTLEYNEKAKIAKDVGAGAVVVAAINAIIVAIVVFGKYIIG